MRQVPMVPMVLRRALMADQAPMVHPSKTVLLSETARLAPMVLTERSRELTAAMAATVAMAVLASTAPMVVSAWISETTNRRFQVLLVLTVVMEPLEPREATAMPAVSEVSAEPVKTATTAMPVTPARPGLTGPQAMLVSMA